MPDLNITIGADLGNTVQKIEGVNKGLKDLSGTAVKTSTALAKMPAATNTAAQSLQNLGRIAQDVPFGFIGIQNNLNPLLEGFQRLKAETGSSKLALKALAGSLIGAGGVGLALSVVSGAILIFQNGIAGFNKKTKEAADTSKDFANALKEAEAGAVSAGLKLQNFVDIAKDQTQALTTRNEALLQANKIMGDHGEKLTLLNIGTKAVTEQIELFTQATIQQALATKFTDKVTDLMIKQMDVMEEQNKAQAEFLRLRTLNNNSLKTTITSATGEERLTKVGSALEKQVKTVSDLKGQWQSVTKELANVQDRLKGAQGLATDFFGKLEHKTKPIKPGIVKQIKEDIEKAFIAEKITLRPELIDISPAKVLLDKAKAEKELNDQLGKFKMVPIKINIDDTEILRKAKEVAKKVEEINIQASENIKQSLNSAFASIGESIAESLGSGADFGKTVFGNLFKVLGAGIKQLGEAMIALGTAKIVLEKFKFAPGIGTVIAGIAAVAIGALLQKAIPSFATGVTNFIGGLAVVGERGPELVRLPRGSDVIPNNRLGGVGAMEPIIIIADSRIRGQDIVTSYKLASQTISRNG